MFIATRKKIFGIAMVLVFLCATMLIVFYLHNIIISSDNISCLKLVEDTTTADKIATAELINTYKWNLYGSCAWLITTIFIATILELVLYNQICPFVEKQLPVCKKCGMTLEDETPFCPYCGNDMTQENPNRSVPRKTQIKQISTKKKTETNLLFYYN